MIWSRAPRVPLILGMFFAVALMAWGAPPALAQFQDDFSRDEFEESDEDFFEEGRGFEPSEDDFTEGGQFIDEEAAPPGAGITISGRRTQLRVRDERQLLPRNVAWGAGTGLLIGGWFALIESGDDRQTQRSIGLGIVFGAILGMTVGLKTVIAPGAPRAAMSHPAAKTRLSPSLALVSGPPGSSALRVGFTLRF